MINPTTVIKFNNHYYEVARDQSSCCGCMYLHKCKLNYETKCIKEHIIFVRRVYLFERIKLWWNNKLNIIKL